MISMNSLIPIRNLGEWYASILLILGTLIFPVSSGQNFGVGFPFRISYEPEFSSGYILARSPISDPTRSGILYPSFFHGTR
ncbi:hypothetical protein EHQ97_02915 [Leptospira adleri]|nr:hypothetical protein EHQ97_02915 [Leptospira adleri]